MINSGSTPKTPMRISAGATSPQRPRRNRPSACAPPPLLAAAPAGARAREEAATTLPPPTKKPLPLYGGGRVGVSRGVHRKTRLARLRAQRRPPSRPPPQGGRGFEQCALDCAHPEAP